MLEKKKILIVDDDKSCLFMLTDILKFDYDVETATSAEEGMLLLKEAIPNILILDVMLPGMDGYHFCEKLKQDPDYKKMKILMLTGENRDDDKLRGFSAGSDEYLTKPFSSVEVKIRIRKLIMIGEEIDGLKQLTQQKTEFVIRNNKYIIYGKKFLDLIHNVKNELGVIQGGVKFVTVTSELNAEDKVLLNTLSDRIFNIADNVNLFLREIKDGERNVIERINVNDILKKEITFLQNAKVLDADISVQLECSSKTPFINGHYCGLSQIFLNLMTNAITALKESTQKKIIISTTSYHKYMLLQVFDSGCGITPQNMPLIFEPFFSTTNDGTGIGLSYVKETVEAWGGLIDVVSTPSEGTTFKLYFPEVQ